MLKSVKQWLSGFTEDAARRATVDLRDEMHRFTVRAEDRFNELTAATQRLEGQINASVTLLAPRIDAVVQSTAAAAEQVERRIDQRHDEQSTTLCYGLRGLLFSNQGTIVKTAAEDIGHLFDGLTEDLLARVAEAVAFLAPLNPVPQWRFGDFLYNPDLGVHLRHSLWLSARARRLRDSIIVPWHGDTKLALHLDNDLSLTFYTTGYFEPNEMALMDRILRPGMVFLDGGANEGLYTVFASARVGTTGRVIAVEPSAREIARLRKNIDLNHLDNVTLIEAALAGQSGLVELRVAEDEHSGQNTLGAFAYQGVNAAATTEVAAISLDELVRQHDVTALDIVKLDIEGAELQALRGAKTVLQELRPLLLIEVSAATLAPQGGSPAELLGLLREAGYVILAIDDETGQPTRLDPAAQPSHNIVAVHHDRNWGLLSI